MGAVRQNMRREHAGGTRLISQFENELICRRAVMIPARVRLIRDHDLAHEGFDISRNLDCLIRLGAVMSARCCAVAQIRRLRKSWGFEAGHHVARVFAGKHSSGVGAESPSGRTDVTELADVAARESNTPVRRVVGVTSMLLQQKTRLPAFLESAASRSAIS